MNCSALLRPLAGLVLLCQVARSAPADSAPTRRFDLTAAGGLGPYSAERGAGFDRDTRANGAQPFYFSVAVPEGNYRVAITFGGDDPADTTVRAESRQLMLEHVVVPAGGSTTREFLVNVRTPRLPPPPPNAPGGRAVLLNDREVGLLRWDEKLTLEFTGPSPRVRAITVTPAPEVTTVFLAGDSTVTDQPAEPTASWGQMLPRFVASKVAVANHAESGETLKSFLSELRLAKILSQIRPGDYLFIQFGHNDEKQQWPQTYVAADTTYRAYLRAYLAEARLHGAIPVLVTSMQRRTFDDAGRIRNTHGGYPEAVRAVAREENVPLIDLDRMSVALYEALGPELAPQAFSQGGKDPTHHSAYGAYELAKCVVQALRATGLPLAASVPAEVPPFDPTKPDAPGAFTLPPSPGGQTAVQRGN
jgi:lysophospholipase L1-like esterase